MLISHQVLCVRRKRRAAPSSLPEADNEAINSWLPSTQTLYATFVIHLPGHVATSNQKRQAWGSLFWGQIAACEKTLLCSRSMSVSAQGTDLASRINISRPFLATRDVRMLLPKGEPPQQHVLIQAQVPTEAMLTHQSACLSRSILWWN